MISRILNSKWTWITAPFLSGFIIFLASTKALTPISSTEGKIFYEKLQRNLNTDTVIPWSRITPQDSGPRSYFWQLVYGYYSSNRFLTLQQLAPEFVTKTADQAVKPFLTSLDQEATPLINRNTFRINSPGLVFANRSIAAARDGNSSESLHNTDLLLQAFDQTVNTTFGDFHDLQYVYDRLAQAVSVTTDAVTLKEFDRIITGTNKYFHNTHPTVDSDCVYRLESGPRDTFFKWQLPTQVIDRASSLISDYGPKRSGKSMNNRQMEGIIPWTRRPYYLSTTLNQLQEIRSSLPRLPESYLSGLSNREQLFALALMIDSKQDIDEKFTSRRIAATRRDILRASIFAKLYYLQFGTMPVVVTDLEKVGFNPAVQTTLKQTEDPATDDKALGPLSLSSVFPSSEDLTDYLLADGRYDFKIESYSEEPGTSNTLWKLSVLWPRSGEADPFDLALQIKSLESRPDIQLTTWSFISKSSHSVIVENNISTTETQTRWQPTDQQLLAHLSSLMAHGNSIIHSSEKNSINITAGLPFPETMTQKVDEAFIEIITPSRLLKITPPTQHFDTSNQQAAYNRLKLYVAEPTAM